MSTPIDFMGPLEVAEYNATDEFTSIPRHVCVCRGDGSLIATVGPAGDDTSLQVGRLFAAAPDLLIALKVLLHAHSRDNGRTKAFEYIERATAVAHAVIAKVEDRS